jgi:hypothetical protein
MSITEIEPQIPEIEKKVYSPRDAALYDSINDVLKLSGIDVEEYLLEKALQNNRLRLAPRGKKEQKGPSVAVNENGNGRKEVKEVGLRDGLDTHPGVSYAYVKLEDQIDEVHEERVIRLMSLRDILSGRRLTEEKIKRTDPDGKIISEEIIGHIIAEDAKFATEALIRALPRLQEGLDNQ